MPVLFKTFERLWQVMVFLSGLVLASVVVVVVGGNVVVVVGGNVVVVVGGNVVVVVVLVALAR